MLLFASYRVLFREVQYFEWYGVPSRPALDPSRPGSGWITFRWAAAAARGASPPPPVALFARPAAPLVWRSRSTVPNRRRGDAFQHDIEDRDQESPRPVSWQGRGARRGVTSGPRATSATTPTPPSTTIPGLESPTVVNAPRRRPRRAGSHRCTQLLGRRRPPPPGLARPAPGRGPGAGGRGLRTPPLSTPQVRRFSVPGAAWHRSPFTASTMQQPRPRLHRLSPQALARPRTQAMEAQVGTKTPSPSSHGPPPRAGNVFGRTWSRAWAYARANPMLAGFIALGPIARIAFLGDHRPQARRRPDHDQVRQEEPRRRVRARPQPRRGSRTGIHLRPVGAGAPARELIYHGGGFLFIRLASLAFFVIAAVYAYRIAAELGVGRWPTALVLAYLALDQNQVFFGVAWHGDPDRGGRAPRERLLRAGRGLPEERRHPRPLPPRPPRLRSLDKAPPTCP